MPFYQKKPVVIVAHQWDGTAEGATEISDWILQSGGTARYRDADDLVVWPTISIDTLEGTMTATQGDFVIKGVQDEFYPCKPDIFEQTYQPITGA